MKKTPKTIQVDAYTDDDGQPVCGDCHFCGNRYRIWTQDRCTWFPGQDCPVWKKQDNTGAEDDHP